MLHQLFVSLIILILIAAFFRTPFAKGMVGEAMVNGLSFLFLDRRKYRLLRNVTLPLKDGGTTQIDHIIVSPYGIFVVETKNLKGWIFGDPKQKAWTLLLFKTKTKFQNPLHQNYKHIKALVSLLNLPEDHFYSLIVFMGECTFKTPMPENVVYPVGYIRYIKAKTDHRLSPDQVAAAVAAIKQARLAPTLTTHREHVRHVRRIVTERSQRCPRCGNALVERISKTGPSPGARFLGCAGYPGCRYTCEIG